MRSKLQSFIVCLVLMAITMFAFGTTYNVGPTRTYKSWQQVVDLLSPGDLVLIDGDATYPGGIYLSHAGTAANPITIRGVRINGNQPIISGGYYGLNIDKAHYNIIEGLVFTASTKSAIGVFADQITIRDCVIRDNEKNGIIGYGTGTGSLLVEYCELYNNGNSVILPDAHQIYMATDENLYPNAVFRLQYCYIHDGKGGNNVKSRSGRNEIYYNWIEGAHYHELSLIGIDAADNPLSDDNTLREDADVVGNVLVNTPTFAIARIGSDGLGTGSFGRYRFVNNTFIMNGVGDIVRANLGIGTLEMHNNVIYNTSNASQTRIFYDGELQWSNGRQVLGTNNWIQSGTPVLPEFSGTISGTDPGFINVGTKNFNLLSTSPLINAANSAPPTIAAYPAINPLFPPLIHPPFHAPQAAPATPRPGVGLLDIGAYEYGTGPSCTYALSSASAAVGIPAGTGSVALNTLSGCAWATNINAPWLTLTSPANGTSSGTINYAYTANPGGPRTGILSVGGQTFTLNQDGVPCTYSLSAANASYTSAGGSGSLAVTAILNCQWTASSSQPWLTVPGTTANGSGNGSVSYNVAPNNTNSSRSATLTIGGQVFTINQTAAIGSCSSVTAAGAADWANTTIATQTTTFVAQFDAAVSSSTINSAIGLSNGPQFSFAGFGCIMLFDVDGKIKGRDGGSYPTSTVSYTAGVSYHFRVPVNLATHTYSIYVTAASGTEQTVGTNFAFRTEQAGITQINNWAATVNYVSAGNMQVCNFTLAAPCSYAVSPISSSIGPAAATGSLNVAATATCAWSATSNAAWLSFTSPTTGTGNGSLGYAVANNTGAVRVGTITVNGQAFTLTQAPAAGCTYAISPTVATFDKTLNTGTIAVTATAACTWTAVSNKSWITIHSGGSGTGNGSVGYTVAANFGVARSGSILVAGESFTIEQEGSSTCFTMNAGGGWTNNAITPQSFSFTAEFDASTDNGQLDGLIGLSSGAQTTFPGFACIVSFSADGLIKARNGAAYTAASAINYAAGVNYHFRLDVDVAAHTYSIYVTPEGGTEVVVGSNFAFRSEQGSVTLLSNWGALVNGAAGIIQVCNFTLSASCNYAISPASVNAAATATTGSLSVTAGAACTWTAVSNDAWITVTAGANGTGNGTVNYSIAADPGVLRTGTITVARHTFTVNQEGEICSYAISPMAASVAATLTTGNLSVTTSTGCTWTATSNDAWLSITAGATGTNNGTVSYSAAANAGPARIGTITAAGQSFSVNQASGCTYAISPTSASAVAAATTGSVSIISVAGCAWTATSNNSWITITSGTSGSGNSTLNYAVAANTSVARSGTITAAGQTFTINQVSGLAAGILLDFYTDEAPPTVSLVAQQGTAAIVAEGVGGSNCVKFSGLNSYNKTYRIHYATPKDISGVLSTDKLRISIDMTPALPATTMGINLNGRYDLLIFTGTIDNITGFQTFDVDISSVRAALGNTINDIYFQPGSGFPADATLKVDNILFVSAAPACAYTIAPISASAVAAVTTGNVSVTAATGCAWTAVSNNSWITVTAGATGTGNGTVSYSVAANTGIARTGTITAAGQTFTINQVSGAAPVCSYTISPTSASATAAITTGTVSVTAGTGCAWTAVSNNAWITVTAGASGSGNGTVTYSVAANSGAARSGTITAAGQTFTLDQVSVAAPVCSYTISPTSASATATATTGTVSVTAGTGCAWTAVSNNAWITVTAGASGTGNGTVSYAVAANTGAVRTGSITIAGQAYSINQVSGATAGVLLDFYTDEAPPDVSLVAQQGGAAIVAEGVGGSNCVKFTGLTSYYKTARIHYATPKDISNVLSTDKLRISIDLTPATPATPIVIQFNGRWDVYAYTPNIDNITGFQTFDIDISSIRVALGNTINDIYFQPGNGFPANASLKVDNIQFISTAPPCTPGTWVGTNGSWNNPANWSCGTLPTAGSNITINSGNPVLDTDFSLTGKLTISGSGSLTINPTKTFTVALGGIADFGGKPVTFKSDVTGSASLGKIVGTLSNASNVTVERYLPDAGFRTWRLLSVPTYGNGQTINAAWQEGQQPESVPLSPMHNYGTQLTNPGSTVTAQASGFDQASSKPSLLKYDGAAWVGLANTNTLTISGEKSYFVFVRGERSKGVTGAVTNSSATTLRTTGTVYTGNQVYTVNPASMGVPFGAVGNLYPSAIDFTLLTKGSNIKPVFYIYDSRKKVGTNLGYYTTFSSTNGYLPATSAVGVQSPGSYASDVANTTIESGQAFMVEVLALGNGAANQLTLTENSKISSSTNLGLRPATPVNNLVKIDSRLFNAANDLLDANVVVFDHDYSNAVGYEDASKIANPGENFAVQKESRSIAIEGRPLVTSNDTIYFKLWQLQQQAYKFDFVPQNLGSSGLTAMLEDSYLNTRTVVDMSSSNNEVNFTVNADAASSATDRFRLLLRPATTLPVSFISISAIRTVAGVQAEWKVAAETNIRSYEVERSTDGRRFSTAGTVTATGNSAAELSYRFTDATAPVTTLFYRVKSIGMAGEIKYTVVVKVFTDGVKPGFTISPNPAEGAVVNLQFKNQLEGRYTVRLLSNSGQVLSTVVATHAGGNSTQVLNLPSGLARSSYQVEIIAPNKKRTMQTLVVSTK